LRTVITTLSRISRRDHALGSFDAVIVPPRGGPAGSRREAQLGEARCRSSGGARGAVGDAIRDALTELGAGAENADIKAPAGQAPWLRLRVGDWRVIYRPLTEAETKDQRPGALIARVVNRRDLLRAVRTL
jgi:hypothetical protein